MKVPGRIALVFMVMATVAAGAWSPARAGGDPIIKMQKEAELEIDLGMIRDDFLPTLLGLAAEEEGEATVEQVRTVLDLVGISALDRLHVSSSIDESGGRLKMAVTLDPAQEGGFLGSLFSVPPGQFKFGRYLRADGTVAVLSLGNLAKGILAVNDFAASPEIRAIAPQIPVDPLGMTSMYGVNAREDVLAYLSGELDLILFPFRPGQESTEPNMAVALALTDGPAFREKMIGILTSIMGEEPVAELTAAPGEKAGAFTFYPLAQNWVYAVSPDFGVVTNDPEGVKALVSRPGSGLPAVEANSYLRVNGDLLLDLASGLVERTGGQAAWTQMVLDALGRVGEDPIGLIELKTSTRADRFEMDLSVPRGLCTAEYRLLKELVAVLPEIKAQEKQKEACWTVVKEVDDALTRYGEEHGDNFPETLADLVAAGHLDAIPDTVQPTPLGQYLEKGYTYLPLHDEAGTVVGYYFFVYGLGEGTGHDVFTAENLADPAHFHAAPDGKPDGVPHFAFGGIAIPYMQEEYPWGK